MATSPPRRGSPSVAHAPLSPPRRGYARALPVYDAARATQWHAQQVAWCQLVIADGARDRTGMLQRLGQLDGAERKRAWGALKLRHRRARAAATAHGVVCKHAASGSGASSGGSASSGGGEAGSRATSSPLDDGARSAIDSRICGGAECGSRAASTPTEGGISSGSAICSGDECGSRASSIAPDDGDEINAAAGLLRPPPACAEDRLAFGARQEQWCRQVLADDAAAPCLSEPTRELLRRLPSLRDAARTRGWDALRKASARAQTARRAALGDAAAVAATARDRRKTERERQYTRRRPANYFAACQRRRAEGGLAGRAVRRGELAADFLLVRSAAVTQGIVPWRCRSDPGTGAIHVQVELIAGRWQPHVYLAPSALAGGDGQPAQLGLFADRPFAAGELIGFLDGRPEAAGDAPPEPVRAAYLDLSTHARHFARHVWTSPTAGNAAFRRGGLLRATTHIAPGEEVVASRSTWTRPPLMAATVGAGVVVRPSRVPDAGLGLFATTTFLAGDCITKYDGERISRTEATQPARVQTHIAARLGVIIDGLRAPLLGRGGGSFANDPRGSDAKPNAELQLHNADLAWLYLVVRRGCTVRPGDEILVDYGRGWEVAMGMRRLV